MKTIANRIKHILPPTVDEIHCAFVPNRMITYNATIAFECVHFTKKKVKGKKGHIALKLVMFKAYDRVEMSFFGESFEHKRFSLEMDWYDYEVCINSDFLSFD